MTTLQTRLKEVRRERGLTQRELARLVGITQATYSELERTTGKGSKHLVTIAAVLRVRPEWLQSGIGLKEARYSTDSALDQEISELWSQIPAENRAFLIQMLRAAASNK